MVPMSCQFQQLYDAFWSEEIAERRARHSETGRWFKNDLFVCSRAIFPTVAVDDNYRNCVICRLKQLSPKSTQIWGRWMQLVLERSGSMTDTSGTICATLGQYGTWSLQTSRRSHTRMWLMKRARKPALFICEGGKMTLDFHDLKHSGGFFGPNWQAHVFMGNQCN